MSVLPLYCFDPGETTGFSKLLIDPDEQTITMVEGYEFKRWAGLENIFPKIEPAKDLLNPPTVICEQLSAQHPSFRQIGIEVMGAIQLLCDIYTVKLVLQSPAVMDAARRLHPMREIKSQHVRDAVHHGIAYSYREFNCKFNTRIEGEEDEDKEEE
jgi:hypothetical protein